MSDGSKDPFESDEPLDQLLRRSARSDVDMDRIDRLADHWQAISQRRVRIRTGATLVMLMVSVGSFLAFRGNWFDTPMAQPGTSPERPSEFTEKVVEHQPISPGSSDEAPAFAADTAYEQLILVAVERKIRQRKNRDGQPDSHDDPSTEQPQPEASEESIDEVVAQTVKRLAENEAYEDLVRRIKDHGSEQELLAWIEAAEDGASIDAALQLLSHVVTKRSIPGLLRLRAMHRERCTQLLLQAAEPRQLFVLAQEETDQALGQELAAALLRHPSPQALSLFLQLVDHRPTSAMALAAVSKVETLPTDLLMNCLSARSRKVRLTAAMVLAQGKDPHVSARLVQLLQGSQTRRAAMVALVASDDVLARQFVDQASRDVYLAASVHAAQTVVSSFRWDS